MTTTVSTEKVLDAFVSAADAVAGAVAEISADARRRRTDRPGQYALDLVADAAALEVLCPLGYAVLSEESGLSGDTGSEVVLVVDPVDGSTNCSRGIPYWATSLCAVDRDGPLVALVRNHASGEEIVAVRGEGARRDGRELGPSSVERLEDAVVALSGPPLRGLRWKQYRVLGCASLTLCDVASGGLDASIDAGSWHAPWDYMGGLLVCTEAGVSIVDAQGRDLVTCEYDARRQVFAAATPELLGEISRCGDGE